MIGPAPILVNVGCLSTAMMDNLGNLGDFIGGIGVVVTLIYLAYQIKQNTSTVKISTAAALVQHSMQGHAFVAQSPEMNRIF